MARVRSPKYPNYHLAKAIDNIEKVYNADRTAQLHRETIAKHLGYSGLSGSSDTSIATIAQYGLLERIGKGEMRVSQLAVDVLVPESEAQRIKAVNKAALTPPLFLEIYNHFEGRTPSDEALRTYLLRRDFNDRAIKPIVKSLGPTFSMIKKAGEKENESESGGGFTLNDANIDEPGDNDVVYGGAAVGNLVQWERDGALQLPTPSRVRHVTEDGDWVFVDGSETGIPMSQTIVEQQTAAPIAPLVVAPKMPLAAPPANDALPEGSFILSSGKVKDVSFEVRVTGEVNQTVIDRIIAYLTLTKDDYPAPRIPG